MHPSRPTRGASDQASLTRGGMRWPEAPGVEMRTRAPEVQAARSRRHELATQSRLAAAPYLRANGQAQSTAHSGG